MLSLAIKTEFVRRLTLYIIMKNILLSFIVLFSSNIIGQNNRDLKFIKENFEKAEQTLKQSKGREALYYYNQVCFLDLKTTLELKARRKIDSLLPIYQKKESEKWNGVWLIKQLKTNRFNYEKIIITEKEIYFYNKGNDTLSSRNEKIKYPEYKPGNFMVNIHSVEFKNNEIWEFSTKKVDNELRLFPNLKTEVDGTTWILLDERAMIRNEADRKKAMAEEIRTYYIRKK